MSFFDKPSMTTRPPTPPPTPKKEPKLVVRTYYYKGAVIKTGVPVSIREVHTSGYHFIVDEEGKEYKMARDGLPL